MSNFDANVLENFASASHGMRRTFVTRNSAGDRVVVRELLYLARSEIFVCAKTLPEETYSAAVFRNIAQRHPRPNIRVLLPEAEAASADWFVSELSDLIAPTGPIELRHMTGVPPIEVIVVDRSHLRIERPPEPAIVDLNAPCQAQNAMDRLSRIWDRARLRARKSQSPVAKEFA